MRKFLLAMTTAVVAAVSMAGVAHAVNTYEVDGKARPNKKGSLKRPVPAKVDFSYQVGDTLGNRPAVIKQYRIASEGIMYFPKARPTCTFAQTDASPSFSRKCRRAVIGKGRIANAFGAATDPTAKAPCDVKLTLINIRNGPKVTKRRGGIAIRIDTDPPACPLSIHGALAAPIYNVRVGGVRSSEYRFTVPESLRHPAPGVNNSVVDVVSHLQKKTGRVKIKGHRRKVGFASSVGRKGKRRTLRVTFVDETGHKETAIKQVK